MPLSTILYKINTAAYQDVYRHLLDCNENFIPKLSLETGIAAYSSKIVQNCVTFEAWENGELAGLIAAYFNDSSKKAGFITSVSTVNRLTGKGIASTLLKQCIAYGEEKEFNEIGLEVSPENTVAVKLYEKYGFIRSALKNDRVFMKKKLN